VLAHMCTYICTYRVSRTMRCLLTTLQCWPTCAPISAPIEYRGPCAACSPAPYIMLYRALRVLESSHSNLSTSTLRRSLVY